MKIGFGIRSPQKGISRPETTTAHAIQPKSFSDVMQQQQDQHTKEQMQQLLDDIQKQADRLKKTMTVRELRKYKLLIKQFLDEAVRKGLLVKGTRGWDRRGRSRKYKLLEQIDQQLLQMTDDLLNSEQGRLALLDQIGEMKGLLINLVY